MHPPVFALEPCAGLADESVPCRIVVAVAVDVSVAVSPERGSRDGSRGAYRTSDDARRDVGRPEAGTAPVPIVPAIVAVPVAIAVGVGIAGASVLAVGVRIELRAV